VIEGVHETPKSDPNPDSKDYLGILPAKWTGCHAFMQGKLKLTGDLNWR